MRQFVGARRVIHDVAWWRGSVKAAICNLGIEVSRWRPPSARLQRFLVDAGIENVIDVGANKGQFGADLRSTGFTGRIISFEPIRKAFEELEQAAAVDAAWETHNMALGDVAGSQSLNISKDIMSSSFLPVAPASPAAMLAEQISVEEVTVARLDDVAPTLRLVGPSLLKIDVQGYQSAVLRGASSTLESLAAVQCEVSVVPLYVGEPELENTLRELSAAGFNLVSLEPGYSNATTGEILQFDARFMRAAPSDYPQAEDAGGAAATPHHATSRHARHASGR